MNTHTRQTHSRRWVFFFLAAFVAIAATLLASTTASAATTTGTENRVGASSVAIDILIEHPETVSPGQQLGNDASGPRIAVATGVAANRGPTFIASTDGVVVPTSRSRLAGGFDSAGLPSTPTTSPGIQYALPDGSLVRIMEPSGQAPLRASFTNPNGGPISPFTGKPVQPPSGLTKPEKLDYIRSRTHVELGP
ncbi:hypothetical protein KV100_12720 [Mumia sp. zg.B21]|uniref:hypothetical protein n=1 Tax=Mumia sp. zg.B21 TaxID=2855447 RepID=UPI001C6F2251|nr:hypothetical protein [Mumia sp. zg.B21]MBW9210517.1 hypothetical protein [Mumia sp. zg.B21]